MTTATSSYLSGCIACLFAWLPAAAAAAGTTARVVKVRSFPCNDEALARTGSGTVVRGPAGQPVILTSSHVLYHGTKEQGVCLSTLSAGGSWSESRLLHVNAGLGLALIELAGEDPGSGVEALNIDEAGSVAAAQPVKVLGFPLVGDIPVDADGRVLLAVSPRILLPLVPEVIEVEQAHAEYGMSGGALVDPSETTYLGLLSHQYLKIEEGRPATAEELTQAPPTGQGELVSLVIPARVVAGWFAALEKKAPGADLAEDLDAQYRGVASVTFGSVRFYEDGCSVLGGVGGQGVGIGGQGVGIGGQDLPDAGAASSSCRIVVEKISGDQIRAQTWPMPASESWFTALSLKIGFGEPLSFSELYQKSSSLKARGLYQALTLIGQGFQPLLLSNNAPAPALSAAMTKQLAAQQKALVKLRLAATGSQAPAAAHSLVDYFDFFARAASTDNLNLIDTKFARLALSTQKAAAFSAGWVFFYNTDFDAALELTEATVQLCDLIERRPGAL